MNRKTYIYSGLAGLITLCLLSVYGLIENKNQDREYRGQFYRHTKIFTPEVPPVADFAGEQAPLDVFFIRESFEREIIANTFMHGSSIMMFKRANRWFPVIEPILKKNGIPDDFKFLALAESNLANVVSPAGAEGFWQFIKPTGQKHKLEINENVDERYHITKATEAACGYFKEAYGRFKNWTLVAASYNRGIDGIAKALKSQDVPSYYDLYLNDETSRYLFRILAIKEVYKNPVKYGFYLRERDFYPQIPSRIIAIDSAISDLPSFAKKMGVSYKVLREMNPWIQSYSLPNKSRKIYTFLIPREGAMNYETLMKKTPFRDTFFHDTLKFNEVH